MVRRLANGMDSVAAASSLATETSLAPAQVKSVETVTGVVVSSNETEMVSASTRRTSRPAARAVATSASAPEGTEIVSVSKKVWLTGP